jgi:BCD family chlorophyll transporter-like MFS transporter
MMIAGFAVTAGVAGHLLDPFSPARLVAVTTGVCVIAFLVTCVVLWRLEGEPGRSGAQDEPREAADKASFKEAIAQVWGETQSRRFAVFIFVSMLAYGAQDLILEPFAGAVFALTPGESTKLSGVQHGGVLAGMILIALAAGVGGGGRAALLRLWTIIGCGASALALFGLAIAGFVGPAWPLQGSVFFLGVANGAYAIAAIGSMMALVAAGRKSREGVRMGLWGAAQAIAFGSGGFLGTVAIDLARHLAGSPMLAYAAVFASEGALFLVAAWLAARVDAVRAESDGAPELEVSPAFSAGARGA